MNKVKKNDLLTLMMQILVWALIFILPALTAYLSTWHVDTAMTTFKMLNGMLRSPLILYFVNYYILWRWLFDKHHYVTFVFANIVLIGITNMGVFFYRQYAASNGIDLPIDAWVYWGLGIFIYFLLIVAVIVVAIVQRHLIKTRKIKQLLEEEKQKSTEAELAWLKSQINPQTTFRVSRR